MAFYICRGCLEFVCDCEKGGSNVEHGHHKARDTCMDTLKFSYDEVNDILEVEGIKFSGNFFRQVGVGIFGMDKCFKIEPDASGTRVFYSQAHRDV